MHETNYPVSALGASPEFDHLAELANKHKLVWRKVARLIGVHFRYSRPGFFDFIAANGADYARRRTIKALSSTYLPSEVKLELIKVLKLTEDSRQIKWILWRDRNYGNNYAA